MADPQVNPAGGASTSWGPETIATDPNASPSERLTQGLNQGGVPIIAPNGDKGWVHHTMLPQFLADNPGYERAMVFTAPDGTPGAVPASKAGSFLQQNPSYKVGLPQTAGWNPEATSRFASAKNFYNSLQNDPDLKQPTTIGGYAKQAVLGPLAAAKGVLRIPQDAASEVGQYLRAEGESPRAPDVVKNVTSPVGEGAAQFAGSQFEPQNLAMLGGFSALPRDTAALRTLHRAIGGYYGTKMAIGAAQQGNQAAAAYQRGDIPEAVRQATGAALGAGMAVGAGKDTFDNPQQAVSDAQQTSTSAREGAADWLRESGSRDIQRVLGPTTKENKAIAQKIAPEIADRGVLAWTRKGLEQKAGATADEQGQQIDDYYQSLPAGSTVPAQPILDHFEQSKEAFKGSKGEVLDQGAIDRIDALKDVVQKFGPDVPVDDIVKLRRLWDGQVAQAKGFYGKTLAEGSAIDAKREAAGAIREELAQQHPDLDKINKEFSFWANVRKVMGDTNMRKGSQATPLGEQLYAAAGLAKGGPKGAIAMALLRKVMTSASWGTVSGATKFKIADMLADGNATGAAKLATPQPPGPGGLPPTILNQPPNQPGGGAPAGAAPATPPVPPVGPFAPGAQAALPFNAAPVPPVAGETPAPEQPPAFPPATGAPSQQPLFRKPWEIARTEGQTPAPAEKVAPAAQEAPQAAPQRSPQQQTAVDQAVAHARNGVTDKATHEPLREQAYEPGKESPEWQGISQAENREGAAGLTSKEVHADASGQYTPEERERIERQKEQILGKDKGADENPVVVFQGGGAASGKTEAIGKELAKKYPGIAVSDPDIIKFGEKGKGFGGADVEGIPGAEMLKHSDPLGAAARLHDESSDIAGEIQKEALRRRQSIIIDGVGGNAEKMKQKMQEFRDAGYRVEVHYADKDLDQALKSMAGRFEKTERWVPTDIMVDGHKKAARAYHQIYPEADESSLTMADRKGADVIGKTTYKVAMKDGKVYDDVLYKKHRVKGGYDDGRDGLQGRQLDGKGPAGTPPSGAGGATPGESVLPVGAGGTSGAEAGTGTSRSNGQRAGAEGDTAERSTTVPAEGERGAGAQQQQVVPSFLRPPKAAAAPAVSTAKQNIQIAQGDRLAGHDGNATSVLTPSGNELRGKYRVVEGDTLTPSHDPFTFAKNPNYPEGVQERAYHTSKEAQTRVIQQAQNYDPRYTVTDDPTGSNGPPVTTPDGTVLGGNSRAMSTQRLYQDGRGDVYKNALAEKAQQFGIDPEQVRGMKNPMLVREIEAPSSQDELRRIGKDLNRSMTGATSTSERAVSAGKSLKPESLSQIGDMVDQEDGSLRGAMQKNGPAMLKMLQSDGVITDRERPGMVDTSTGGLNEDGKNFVEKALIGSVVDDPDLMDRTPKNVINKLGSALGDLSALSGRSDEYNIGSLIRSALREHVAAAQAQGPLEDYLNQSTMFGPERSAPVEALARALDGPVKELRAKLRSFAQDARQDVAGQSTMLMEKPTAADAFNHAFGTKVTEADFHDALRGAMEAEAPKAPTPQGYGDKNTIVTREEYEQTKKDLSHELMGQMNAGVPLSPRALVQATKIGMYHLEAGTREFGEWSQKMVDEFGKGIKPQLRTLFNKSDDALREQQGAVPKPKLTFGLDPQGDKPKDWTDIGAKADGKFGGFIRLAPEDGGNYSVRMVAVDHAMRRTGIASQLYQKAIEWAKKQGATEITSDPRAGTEPEVEPIWQRMGARRDPKATGKNNRPLYRLDLTK